MYIVIRKTNNQIEFLTENEPGIYEFSFDPINVVTFSFKKSALSTCKLKGIKNYGVVPISHYQHLFQ